MAHQPTEASYLECLDRITDTRTPETHAQLVCQLPGGFATFNGKGHGLMAVRYDEFRSLFAVAKAERSFDRFLQHHEYHQAHRQHRLLAWNLIP
ncbi:hypothetical protein ACFWIX_08245 [Pseudarthrobacter sp. NPDC058362]|uniref:hypothetical protein n=1 Tax=Pseudarthrobacter sp. NPDC058362 TaxID=3346458 RepID=UPI00365A630C